MYRSRTVITVCAVYALITASTAATVQAADDATLAPSNSPAVELRIENGTASYELSPNAQGLKAKVPRSALPFGMDYNGAARTLIVPLDDRYDWGVGLDFDAGSPPPIELAPASSLGLQPKHSPGLLLQRRF
jgi:hypothetical protein